MEPQLVHISSEFIGALVPQWGDFLFGDKACSMVFDNSKIKRVVPDFAATVPFARGVRASIAWFDADERRKTTDGEVDAHMDRVIAAYERSLQREAGQK